MKLRIHDDSVRLRLTRTEVDRIARGLDVESVCRFTGVELRYALVVRDAPAITTRLDGGRIEVSLPRAVAEQWAVSDTVSLRGESGPAATPSVLIEKDFECVEPRDGEDAADLYPNPKARRTK